jgi:hypothetical protein
MMKLISSLLTGLGLGAAAVAAPNVQHIDPKTIRFSMPTVAADELQFVMPTNQSFEGAPQFHEDEWCQIEFYPEERLAYVKQMLTEYNAFERKHRIQHGWTQIYARRVGRSTIVSGNAAVENLSKALRATHLPSPILTITSRPLGQVAGGFTLRLPGSVLLYGRTGEQGVNTLAAMVEPGGDDMQLTKAFASLSKSHRLVLVDWRSQMVLMSVAASGELNVWRPN